MMHLLKASYRIHLPIFEGPLDLLLHLIRKEDLSIADIPISVILDQYLEMLGRMQELNIEVAGEFILMAAELAEIKSRMLLPEVPTEENEEGEDPRADLARRLLEYQRYQQAAEALSMRPLLGRDVFVRPVSLQNFEKNEPELVGDPFKLLFAFGRILKHLKPEQTHQIILERLSVTEKIYDLMERLEQSPELLPEEIFPLGKQKSFYIVTFLALLEMVRLKWAALVQDERSTLVCVLRLGQFEKDKMGEWGADSEFDRSNAGS